MRSKLAREGRRNYISDSKYHYNSTDYRLETQTERGGLATASVRSDKKLYWAIRKKNKILMESF